MCRYGHIDEESMINKKIKELINKMINKKMNKKMRIQAGNTPVDQPLTSRGGSQNNTLSRESM